MKLLQVGGCADRLDELLAADLCAAGQELLHERTVEDLAEREAKGCLGTPWIGAVDAERLEHVESDRIDVGDERITEPGECLFDIAEIAVCDCRRAP
jgi:hypothetical protein